MKSEDHRKWRGAKFTWGIHTTVYTILEWLPLLVGLSKIFFGMLNPQMWEYMYRMDDGIVPMAILALWHEENLSCHFNHVCSVFCLLSYILPLWFPYQFLPLLLLGLSVKVEKSKWEVWVDSLLCLFMIWVPWWQLMPTKMHHCGWQSVMLRWLWKKEETENPFYHDAKSCHHVCHSF